MANRDQQPIVIDDIQGLFDRGNLDAVPPNHASAFTNAEILQNGFVTRKGFINHLTPPSGKQWLRIHRVQFSSDSQPRYFCLASGGKLYDNLSSGALTTEIYNASGQVDFSIEMLYDRAYISFHDKKVGSSSIGLIVYRWGKIGTVNATPVVAGTGYVVGDIVKLTAGDGNATIKVLTLSGSGIATFSLETKGTGYTVATSATEAITGVGINATIQILTISDNARLAAGTKPIGFTIGAAAGAAGKCETGRRLIAVAYETDSGFITTPGPVSWTLFNLGSPGAKKIDLTALPVGPAGTQARHILVSRVIFNYNSRKFLQTDHELFFVPNGRIADNTRTTFTIDYFDAELFSSADYLIDQKETISAGVCLRAYNGRLLLGGPARNVTTDTFSSAILASKSGAPESFDATDGAAPVYPDDAGGGVRNIIDDRGILYIFKAQRTYVTQDNGGSISTWRVDLLDGGIGAGPFGVSKILDSRNSIGGTLLIADQSGIRLLNGQYSPIPLTYKVDAKWDQFAKITNNLNACQILVDTTQQKIYVYWDLGSSSLGEILVGDYSNGLDPQSIRWSIYDNGYNVVGIYFAHDSGSTSYTFYIGLFINENDWKSQYMNPTHTKDADADGSNDTRIIATNAEFALVQFSQYEGVSQFHSLRFVAKGIGRINITLRNRDDGGVNTPPFLTLNTTLAPTLLRQINYISDALGLRIINGDTLGDFIELHKVVISGKPIADERPQ